MKTYDVFLCHSTRHDTDTATENTMAMVYVLLKDQGVRLFWDRKSLSAELYFLAPDATLMAVPVTAAGTSFEAGSPVALFPTRIVAGGNAATNRPQDAVARDGRFLVNQPVGDATAAPITLILNWQGGL